MDTRGYGSDSYAIYIHAAPLRLSALTSTEMIDVTAAILRKGSKIMIARRAAGKHLEGYWEFPGGKLEEGEAPEKCLARELLEELGISAQIGDHVGESIHNYGEKCIRLIAYEVWDWSGVMAPSDHDLLEWIDPENAAEWKLAPADVPLLAFIK